MSKGSCSGTGGLVCMGASSGACGHNHKSSSLRASRKGDPMGTGGAQFFETELY